MTEVNCLPLQRAGLEEGDFIVKVGQNDVRWCTHDEVVTAIKTEGCHLTLHVITPLDRNYLNPVSPTLPNQLNNADSVDKNKNVLNSNTLDRGKNGHVSSKSNRSTKSLTWTFGRLYTGNSIGSGARMYRKSDSRKARA